MNRNVMKAMATQACRPIVMTGESVNLILRDLKTQTRRVIRPQPDADSAGVEQFIAAPTCIDAPPGTHFWRWLEPAGLSRGFLSPYGQRGTRLWVKETWYDDMPGESNREREDDGRVRGVEYRASHECTSFEAGCPCNPDGDGKRSEWKSPRFMPRWASRLTLEVTWVAVERLQDDLTEEAAYAEGLRRDQTAMWKSRFAGLWDAINGKTAPWASNPWVWRVEFRRVET